jgi:hypothetical protein
MSFSTSTRTLAALEVDDVLVGEPTAAAPNGYLRAVTAIAKPKKGPIVVETRQAYINEAIQDGTLDAGGQLEPDDLLRTEALPGSPWPSRRGSRRRRWRASARSKCWTAWGSSAPRTCCRYSRPSPGETAS